jgi:hypothetical protein
MHIEQNNNRFRASSLQLLTGIPRNFMGTFNTKRRCAYHCLVPLRLFNTELWPLISSAVCIYSNNRFLVFSLQLPAGIQWNFIGNINTKRKCAYHCLVRPSRQSYGPWCVCSTHIEQYYYFFSTAGLISTRLNGNHQYQKESCMPW